MQHFCEFPGCGTMVETDRFMCFAHWSRVPKALQRAVWATWRSRVAAIGTQSYRECADEHERAKADAVAALRPRPPDSGTLAVASGSGGRS